MTARPAGAALLLDEDRLRNPRALLFLLGAALGLLGGFAVMMPLSMSVFVKPLSEAMGWGRAQASLLSAMSFAGFTIAVPFTPMLIERIGIKRTMWAGYLGLSGCLLLLGIVPAQVLLFSLIAFLSGLLTTITTPSGFMILIGQVFDRRLGTAIGLSMIGFGIGAVGMPVFANHVLGLAGWQGAFMAMGLLTLILGASSILLISGSVDLDEAFRLARRKRSVEDISGDGALRAVVRAPRFWIVALAMLGTSIAGFGAITHIPAALADRGLSPAEAALSAGMIGIGLLVGRIMSAMLMDLFHAPLVSAIFICLGGLGLQIVLAAPLPQLWLIAAGVILSGLIVGTESDMGPVLIRRYFPPEIFNRAYGVIAFLAGLGGMAGPFLFGYLRDVAGSYDLPFGIGVAICFVTGGGVLLLGRYRYAPER